MNRRHVIPRSLTLSLDGEEFSVTLTKVDRSDLYGDVEIEAFDERGRPASIMVLAGDGNTIIDKGGTALEMVNKTGDSIDREDIRAVGLDGEAIAEVTSSFSQTNKLSLSTTDDYLSLIVKSVYWLQPAEDSTLDPLLAHLGDGRIFSFPFSYRDGIETNEAFLIGNKKEAFMIVGDQATLEFVKFNQSTYLDSTEEQEVSTDDLDFDLL